MTPEHDADVAAVRDALVDGADSGMSRERYGDAWHALDRLAARL